MSKASIGLIARPRIILPVRSVVSIRPSHRLIQPRNPALRCSTISSCHCSLGSCSFIRQTWNLGKRFGFFCRGIPAFDTGSCMSMHERLRKYGKSELAKLRETAAFACEEATSSMASEMKRDLGSCAAWGYWEGGSED